MPGQPTQIVRDYFAAFAAGNVEAALTLVHPDAVWHIDGDPAVPTVGIVRGREAVRAWLLRFPDGFRPLAFSLGHLLEAGEEVVALGRFRHHVVATGATVDSDYAIRFTLRDGAIARYQIFEDSLLLSQVHRDAAPSRSALINGIPYGWDDVGQGAPVIFLHGLFLDRRIWSEPMASLGRHRRCVAFDMPGHGASGWRDGLDLDGIAGDIALWLMEHGGGPATFVGHSQGGMVAMRIAARHPALVGRLVLVNTGARAEAAERLPAWQERRRLLLAGGAERRAMFRAIQRFTTAPAWLDAHPAAAEAELGTMMRHDPALLVQALDAAVLGRSDIRPLLRTIRAPTLVLSGERDDATPAALGEEMKEAIPSARHAILPGVAHHIPTEAPQAIVSAVLET